VDGDARAISNPISLGLEPLYIQWIPDAIIYLPTIARGVMPVINGAFEKGIDGSGNPSGWIYETGPMVNLPRSLVTQHPTNPWADALIPAGTTSLLLGGTGLDPNPADNVCNNIPLESYAGIKQTIRVPRVEQSSPVSLSFDYIIYTQDGSAGPNFDRFEILIDSGLGPEVIDYFGNMDGKGSGVDCSWKRIPSAGWKTHLIDLRPYRGDDITIYFRVYNWGDAYYNTITYLDNVKVVYQNVTPRAVEESEEQAPVMVFPPFPEFGPATDLLLPRP
jgi:hypothetical protein